MTETAEITVWAPHANSLQIALGEAADPTMADMAACGNGWWRWEGDRTAYGDHLDYAFVIDGDLPALPDPRSAWQPSGVHGPSRFVDLSQFAWSDDAWRGTRSGAGILGAVVYEMHIGTFTAEGTLDAAIGRLDHLVDLGADVVQVLPVAAFPGRWGWGYDGVALYAVHDAYGGPAALQRFVDAAHHRGLAVCLDVVYNHLGPSGNYLSRFGPYFTDRYHTPWGEAVNLDGPQSDSVRAFIIDNALRWFRDFHIDALRLDATHELRDDSPRHLLAELSDRVNALAVELGRPLDLIAESDLNDTRVVAPTDAGGQGITAQWDDDIHHALHVTLTGESQGYYGDFGGGAPGHDERGPLAVLAKVFTRGFLHDGTTSSFRGTPWGAPVDRQGFDARKLLAYLQTHDQVGNRALGERITALLPADRQAMGAALYLLGPFTPMLFAGEEWASSSPWLFFTSFEEEALARSVRDGRRAEFAGHGWDAESIPDPQDSSTRDASVLRWAELGEPAHAEMLDWYRALIGLRRKRFDSPAHLADVTVSFDEEAGWFCMSFSGLTVALNLGGAEATVPLAGTAYELILDRGAHWDGGELRLRPDGVAVLAQG
ncbi:MAG: malto-oligosyltrehalose trehalohydrolase [Actinobacteria bacterium]|uniref:Malto-oligosyltrehalose trehalohydrolase n=1 Tax=Nostocoides veronense TaxID=330836 RepID=A0ABP4XKB8_9MICO|nr:malto-oligosyltrehalose trehalohydrolase [Actinomycetota bacterium]